MKARPPKHFRQSPAVSPRRRTAVEPLNACLRTFLTGDPDDICGRKRRRLNRRREPAANGRLDPYIDRQRRLFDFSCLEEHRDRQKRADRNEYVRDHGVHMMFTARPALWMRAQVLIQEGEIVQKSQKPSRACDQQNREQERRPVAGNTPQG